MSAFAPLIIDGIELLIQEAPEIRQMLLDLLMKEDPTHADYAQAKARILLKRYEDYTLPMAEIPPTKIKAQNAEIEAEVATLQDGGLSGPRS